MEEEDKTFYGAIIAACIIGIIIISYSIISSPKYEENYTELYFYGEKIALSENKGDFNNYTLSFESGTLHLKDIEGNIEAGPLERGSTFILNGEYWNVEDISGDHTEVMLRKFPLQAAQGDFINTSFVIVNHKNRDLDYTWEARTLQESKSEIIPVKDEEIAIINVEIQLPYIITDENGYIGSYIEEFTDFTRYVDDYGDIKHVIIKKEDINVDEYWRAKVTISINTGNEIHFWVSLDDE